jgi:hypothetical protein
MSTPTSLRRTAVSAACLMFLPVVCQPALAQVVTTTPIAAPPPADPVDVLSAYLRTLAASPRNYLALIGAGDAALQVGDPNAALGFFARAEKVDPRSGRAKAGLGAALVALERPNDALPLFGEAVALGVSEVDVARDRGLAYDLRGDPKRAQRDYALVMQRSPDDETVRRYALSLGISGDTRQALGLLDPLLRKKDQSAWRARAFIMAMNGDVNGANGIARQVMPGNLANTMAPFLGRLASLNPADRAHAVNFGTMPSNGVAMAAVEIGDPFRPVGGGNGAASTTGNPGNGLIPAGDPFGPRPEDIRPTRVIEPYSNEPRRRPGGGVVVAALPPAPAIKPEGQGVTTVSPAPRFPPAAAPGFSVASAAPASAAPRIGERVGARIAAIDPSRLPPEARSDGSPSVIVGTAATSLPPPAGVSVQSGVIMQKPPATPAVAAAIADRPAFETSPAPSRLGVIPPAVPPVVRPAPSTIGVIPPAAAAAPAPVSSALGVIPAGPAAIAAPPAKPAITPTALPASTVAPAVVAPAPVTPNGVVPSPPVVTPVAPAPLSMPQPALPEKSVSVMSPQAVPNLAPAAATVRAAPLIGPPVEGQGITSAPAQTAPFTPAPVPAPALAPAPQPTSSAPEAAASVAVAVEAAPAVVAAPPTPPVASPSQPPSRLASILEGIEPEPETSAVALPSAAEIRATKRAALRKAAEDKADALAAKTEKDAKAAEKAAEAEVAKRNPARIWVQIATGANTRGLGTTWARIRDGNAVALKGRSAWTLPFKATNRLLVGPMKSPADARALVNALAKGNVAATTFSSEAGQDVARVGGK